MTERTLREKIEGLKVGPYQSRIQHPSVWNLAITEVLALLDAHTAAQPAPDAVAEGYICRTCRRTDPNWQLCNHPACADGR